MTSRIIQLWLMIALVGTFFLAGCDPADVGAPTGNVVIKFANLRGSQVVPAVVSSLNASGSLSVNTTTGAISGSLRINPQDTIFTAPTATITITAVEVREGGPGTNGGIVASLTDPGGSISRVPVGTVLTPAQVNSFIAGNFYFTVQTISYPGGEIRGQVNEPPPIGIIRFNAVLQGSLEVTPVAFAIGELFVDTTTGAISGDVSFAQLPASTVTAVNVYEGAFGVNGGIVTALTGSSYIWNVPTGTALTPAQVISFSAGNFYFNVLTDDHPEGEIRGQLDNFRLPPPPAAVIKAETIVE